MNWVDSGELQLRRGARGDLNVIFAGDFCPTGRAIGVCMRGDFAALFGDSISLLTEKDLSVVNLECPLTGRNEPIVKAGPHLSAPQGFADALRYARFDVAALANNHILDHGPAGLADTIDACRLAGIKTVGAAKTLAEAQEPLFIESRAGLIAIVNMAEIEFSIAGPSSAGANPLDPAANYAQIMRAKSRADIVFIVVHGGHEFYPLPSPRMVQTYRFFASLGVTAVIGHHSHVGSGFEIVGGVPIFYSLGNFLFDTAQKVPDGWHNGYFVRLSVHDGKVSRIHIVPYEQSAATAGIRLLNPEAKRDYLQAIAHHCDAIQDPVRLSERWEAFCRSNEYYYLTTVLRLGKLRRACLRAGLPGAAIGPHERLVKMYNLICCEAHRDAVLRVLENVIGTKGEDQAETRAARLKE